MNANACGPWYPYGDEVRFSLLDPSWFDDGGMSPYYYTAENFGVSYQSDPFNDPNVALWSDYVGGDVPMESIYGAIYEIEESSVRASLTKNAFLKKLYDRNDSDAIDYILFAKGCSHLNEQNYYGWEIDDHDSKMERAEAIIDALTKSVSVENEMLRKRYRFLAIRLAFYNNDERRASLIYEKSFKKEKKDIIDYMALHYVSAMRPKSAETNYNLAQVFSNAPGKRFAALVGIKRSIAIEEVLKFAETNEERANVYLAYSIRNKGRNLENIRQIQQLSPNHHLLDYLIVREVNKIEDWVLTPRYTQFPPAMDARESFYGLKGAKLMKERIEDDKKYALEMANWLVTTKASTELKSISSSKAYLMGISGETKQALNLLNRLSVKSPHLIQLKKQLELLFKIQQNGNVQLTQIQETMVMNASKTGNEFLFALGREFEYQEKFTMAASLFSHVNRETDYYGEGVSWRTTNGKSTLRLDFYWEWFFYLDGQYSAEQVQEVIDFTNKDFGETSIFDQWQRKYLSKEVNRMYDLLGTKYVRENNFDQAIASFEKVGTGLWDSQKYPYGYYLNANPFHADFYSAHESTKYDTVSFNKLELLRRYQSYEEEAENTNSKNRSYYYFLLANCELNMSQYGNSWMMRRYFWTANASPNYLVDDDDYFRCKKAKELYLRAAEFSSDEGIKALCLRMAGRCEQHQLNFDSEYKWDEDYDKYGGFNNYRKSKNQSYKKLKTEYAAYSNELMSNCHSFQRYFSQMKVN